jgi:hypothetical protein
MSKKEAIFFSLFVVVFGLGFIYYMKNIYKPKTAPVVEQVPVKATKKAPEAVAAASTTDLAVHTIQTWVLPPELKEISGNVLIDDHRMACINDNDGIIYIYNLQAGKIEQQIQFGEAGDYESIARVGSMYYVLRSDGVIFEIQQHGNSKPDVKTYETPLKADNETESMFYDSAKNRLLIAVKNKDLTKKHQKGVYSFKLNKKKMDEEAVFYIGESTKDEEESDYRKEKKRKKQEIRPSEIAIHPKTGEVYILNGPRSELLIAEPIGLIKSIIQLDHNPFTQPEGLCFSPNGDLYISSEGGKKGQGVIAKVQF